MEYKDVKDIRGRKKGIRAIIAGHEGPVMSSGGKAIAFEACENEIRHLLRNAEGTPKMIRHRGEVAVILPRLQGWDYSILDSEHFSQDCYLCGNYGSSREAEKACREHLAQRAANIRAFDDGTTDPSNPARGSETPGFVLDGESLRSHASWFEWQVSCQALMDAGVPREVQDTKVGTQDAFTRYRKQSIFPCENPACSCHFPECATRGHAIPNNWESLITLAKTWAIEQGFSLQDVQQTFA